MLRRFSTYFLAWLLIISASVSWAADFKSPAKSILIMDMSSDHILFEKNADARMAPASLSKLMTIYMALDQLKQGKIKLGDQFKISNRAYKRGGSTIFANINSEVSVKNLIKGVAIVSGNDAAIALAEGISSTEDEFAKQLNQLAKKIGLTDSNFRNATGWPDEEHYMTLRDVATLSKRLILDFPEYYHYFSIKEFSWEGITQPNLHPLLAQQNVDGLKTGYTDQGGFGMVTSNRVGGVRNLVVMSGMKSKRSRKKETLAAFDWLKENFEQVTLFEKAKHIKDLQVYSGSDSKLSAMLKDDLKITIDKDKYHQLNAKIVYKKPLIAPIMKDQHVADLIIYDLTKKMHQAPLYATKDIAKGGRVDISQDIIKSWVTKQFNQIWEGIWNEG